MYSMRLAWLHRRSVTVTSFRVMRTAMVAQGPLVMANGMV